MADLVTLKVKAAVRQSAKIESAKTGYSICDYVDDALAYYATLPLEQRKSFGAARRE